MRSNQNGLTYVEVLVAMTLMILLFTLIGKLNLSAYQQQHQDLVRQQMLFFAQGAFEEYQYQLQTNQLSDPMHPPAYSSSLSLTYLPSMTAAQSVGINSKTGMSQVTSKVVLNGEGAASRQPPVFISGYSYPY